MESTVRRALERSWRFLRIDKSKAKQLSRVLSLYVDGWYKRSLSRSALRLWENFIFFCNDPTQTYKLQLIIDQYHLV